jgi:hypothetical protein
MALHKLNRTKVNELLKPDRYSDGGGLCGASDRDRRLLGL